MIAQHPKTAAKPQTISIGLDAHGQVQSVNVAYEVECGRHRFNQGATWHDSAGHSIHRADDHLRRMLEALVAKIIEDTRRQVEE